MASRAKRATRPPLRARTSGVPLPSATVGQLCDEIPGAELVAGARTQRVREVRRDARAVERGDLFVLDDRKLGPRVVARTVREALARGAACIARVRADEADVAQAARGVCALRVPDPVHAAGIASSAVWGHPSFSVDVLILVGDGRAIGMGGYLLREMLREAFGADKVGEIGARQVTMPARTPRSRTREPGVSLAHQLARMRDARAEYVVLALGWDELVAGAVLGTNARALVVPPPTTRSGALPAAERARRVTALGAIGAPTWVLDLDSSLGQTLHARFAPEHGGVYTVASRGRHPEADLVVGARERTVLHLRVGERPLDVIYFGAVAEVMAVATLAAIGGADLAARLPKVLSPRPPRALPPPASRRTTTPRPARRRP